MRLQLGEVSFPFLPLSPAALIPSQTRRDSAGRRAGTGGAPQAPALRSGVPHPPPAAPPTPLSRPLTSRPGRRDPGKEGYVGRRLRTTEREEGGRAVPAQSFKTARWPRLAPQPIRRSSRQRRVSRGRVRGPRAQVGGQRGRGPCRYWARGGVPAVRGGHPSLRKLHPSSARLCGH